MLSETTNDLAWVTYDFMVSVHNEFSINVNTSPRAEREHWKEKGQRKFEGGKRMENGVCNVAGGGLNLSIC